MAGIGTKRGDAVILGTTFLCTVSEARSKWVEDPALSHTSAPPYLAGNINRKRIRAIRTELEKKGWASTGFWFCQSRFGKQVRIVAPGSYAYSLKFKSYA